MRMFFNFNDWWIGYYRGANYHFVCLLPTVAISWPRKHKDPNWRIGVGQVRS
jgi:hypothetical protein